MKKNIQTLLIITLLTSCLILFLKESEEVIESVTFSISIWKDNLLPSLFPFLILSFLLMNYGISDLLSQVLKPFVTNILHLPSSCGFTIIASILSGFPSNAKFIKEQLDKKEINIKEAEYLLGFCFSSSPLFVIGTVGSLLLGNRKLGILILFAHYLGNFCIAMFFRPRQIKERENANHSCFLQIKKKIATSKPFALVLKDAISTALDVLFLLFGIVTVFLIITNLITTIIPLTIEQRTFLSGILEMTQGTKNASMLVTSSFHKSLIMLAIISFGGLSVHTQILSILSEYKISYFHFLIKRICHILFSSIAFLILTVLFL